MEDDDAVLVDNVDFTDSDPRLRASQVGVLEDDEEESEGATGDEDEDKDEKDGKEDEKEKEEPIYFQGEDNSKGFEVDTPQAKPQGRIHTNYE